METSIALKVIIAAVIIALYRDVIGLGCSAQTGCCPLNCTHVLNYEMCLSRYGIYKMYAHFLACAHTHTCTRTRTYIHIPCTQIYAIC